MTTNQFSKLRTWVLSFLIVAAGTAQGIVSVPLRFEAVDSASLYPMSSESRRTLPMDNRPHEARSPEPDVTIRQSRFKRLRHDPLLLKLKHALHQLNLSEDPSVQRDVRLVESGTEKSRERAILRIVSRINDYEKLAVDQQDSFMPYLTAEQIGLNGAGIHILNQVGNDASLRASKYSYCLLWLVVGSQGGGKSSAVYYQLSQLHDVPFVILDPKSTWEFRAEQLGATVIPPQHLRFDLQFNQNLLSIYLHSVAEGIAFCTGLQYGLSCLYEALGIAQSELNRYAEQTSESTSLCLKDIQQALYLCDTKNPRRAQYFEAARTALDLLIGRNDLFSTRSGLPLDALFTGRYIIPCWHLSTTQCRFLAWFLLNNLQFRSLQLPETTDLKSLFIVDDASRFISRPDTVFGSGTRTSVYLHLLSTLRSTGRGCLFVSQNVEAISDDVKGLCTHWLLVGGIHGTGNQSQVAAAMNLTKEQTAMLGKLQCRESVCFCPTTYPKAIRGFIPEI